MANAMNRITPITGFDVPLGGQRVELQQVDYAAGGMSLLRVRIREGSRYTVFDIDPATAGSWGRALLAWAEAREKEEAA
jgi:DNA-binding IclR family transcriptional regulator